jgi:hypothetical protein
MQNKINFWANEKKQPTRAVVVDFKTMITQELEIYASDKTITEKTIENIVKTGIK